MFEYNNADLGLSQSERDSLGHMIVDANFFRFKGKGWDKTIQSFCELVAGNPEKCHDILCWLVNGEVCAGDLGDIVRRYRINFYLELMLFMADKIGKDK